MSAETLSSYDVGLPDINMHFPYVIIIHGFTFDSKLDDCYKYNAPIAGVDSEGQTPELFLRTP